MLRQMMILLMLSTILTSCNSSTLRFKIHENFLVKMDYSEDGEVIDVRCFKRTYDLNNFRVVEKAERVDLSRCDNMVGFFVDDWATDIIPTAKAIKSKCMKYKKCRKLFGL